MKLVDYQERLERVAPEIRLEVEMMLKCLFENSTNFDEMTAILETVHNIVREQIKKVDTNELT